MSALFYVWEFYLSHNIAIYADKSGHFVRLERVFGSGVLLGIVLMYSYVLFHEVLIWLSNMCWPINSLNVWKKKRWKNEKNMAKFQYCLPNILCSDLHIISAHTCNNWHALLYCHSIILSKNSKGMKALELEVLMNKTVDKPFSTQHLKCVPSLYNFIVMNCNKNEYLQSPN